MPPGARLPSCRRPFQARWLLPCGSTPWWIVVTRRPSTSNTATSTGCDSSSDTEKALWSRNGFGRLDDTPAPEESIGGGGGGGRESCTMRTNAVRNVELL